MSRNNSLGLVRKLSGIIFETVVCLRTKLRRALSTDSESWHAKTVDPSEQSKLSPMSITLFYHCNLITQNIDSRARQAILKVNWRVCRSFCVCACL